MEQAKCAWKITEWSVILRGLLSRLWSEKEWKKVCKQKVQKTKRAGKPENTGVTRMAGPKSGSRRLYPTFAVQQHREHSGPEIIPAPACFW